MIRVMSTDVELTGTPEPTDAPEEAVGRAPLPRWKKILLGVAGLFVVTGFVLLAIGPGESGGDLSTSQSPGHVPAGAAGFDVSNPGGQPTEAQQTENALAPVFLKLGFSFFVGFAVGYAFRAFLKLTLIFVGVLLIALFLLSYVNWVTVNWDTMASAFDIFVRSVKDDTQAFQTFISGSLPQAGLASLGLVAGFKRN